MLPNDADVRWGANRKESILVRESDGRRHSEAGHRIRRARLPDDLSGECQLPRTTAERYTASQDKESSASDLELLIQIDRSHLAGYVDQRCRE